MNARDIPKGCTQPDSFSKCKSILAKQHVQAYIAIKSAAASSSDVSSWKKFTYYVSISTAIPKDNAQLETKVNKQRCCQ